MGAAAAAVADEPREIRPHPGPQWQFLSTPADIAIYGGAAGGGKTFALLLEPLRHVGNSRFGAVCFRRELTRVTAEGGLWDESTDLYRPFGARSRQSPRLEHVFPSGARLQFGHLEHEDDKDSWAGSQIALLLFDQLEEILEPQFWFLQSRNRSTSGVRSYLRATCNPVPPSHPVGGWLAKLIQWWWDADTGFPIPERSGVLRWFVRIGEELQWADAADELRERFPDCLPQSLTFIGSKLEDNPSLEEADPAYRAKLMALPRVERERLLGGNWKVTAAGGGLFRDWWFPIVPRDPADLPSENGEPRGEAAYLRSVRAWDLASTPGDGDRTAGVKVGRRADNGRVLIRDVVAGQYGPRQVKRLMADTMFRDGPRVVVRFPVDPAQAGKAQLADVTDFLRAEALRVGMECPELVAVAPTGSKYVRARPLASAAQPVEGDDPERFTPGNVDLVAGSWNADFAAELHAFDGLGKQADDRVDAAADAYNEVHRPEGSAWGWAADYMRNREGQEAQA